jgi:hypothetical protein
MPRPNHLLHFVTTTTTTTTTTTIIIMAKSTNYEDPYYAVFSDLLLFPLSWVQIISLAFLLRMSWDSSVGIATGYRLDDRNIGVRFMAGAGNFSLRHHVQTGSGAHPASYPMGPGSSFRGRGEKRLWREADHSSPSSAVVKGGVELYLHSPILLHDMMLS